MQVWARDQNRVRRGLLTVVEATAVLRETGVGTWSMTLADNPADPQIDEGWGVIVVDDGETLFSGPVTKIGIEAEGSTRDRTISGVTDKTALADRIVYPDPASSGQQQSAAAYWAKKGPAESLIADLVNRNAGPAAIAARRTPGLLSHTSAGRGKSSTVNARFSNLLDEVNSLATVGGLVVDVLQDGRDLVLQVRTPMDRSRSVRFMAGSGLKAYSTTLTAATVSTVLVAGQGEGAARTLKEHTSPVAWGRRIELFQDRRDTDDAEELVKAGVETLSDNAASAAATFPVEETSDRRFGIHYHLGDTLTVALPGGGEIIDGLRVAEISWDEYGRTVELTIGEHSTDEDKAPSWVQKIRDLQRKVQRLEAK